MSLSVYCPEAHHSLLHSTSQLPVNATSILTMLKSSSIFISFLPQIVSIHCLTCSIQCNFSIQLKPDFLCLGCHLNSNSILSSFSFGGPTFKGMSMHTIFMLSLTVNYHLTKTSMLICVYHINDNGIRNLIPSYRLIPPPNALVLSCLNYCNSLFAGFFKSRFQCLQRIPNSLAQAILRQ